MIKAQSLTITSLLIMAVIFIGGQANIKITEGDLQQTIDTIIKLIGIVSWGILYVKRLLKGDVKIFGGIKWDHRESNK